MNELLNWNETLCVLWVTGRFAVASNSPASSKRLLNVLGERLNSIMRFTRETPINMTKSHERERGPKSSIQVRFTCVIHHCKAKNFLFSTLYTT